MKKPKKLPKCVRPEEWLKLVSVIPAKDKLSIVAFLLAYGSGMRISEVLICEKKDFQSDGMILIEDSKYGTDRKVPIPKGWRDSFFSLLPMGKSKKRTVQRRFEKYRDLAELNPKYTFHSLRHGFATRLVESGTPINIVSLALGHADVSTTGIYTKASPQDLLKHYQEGF